MKHPFVFALLILLFATLACGGGTTPLSPPQPATTTRTVSRSESIPANAHKMTSAEDAWPPVPANGLEQPQPLSAPINTAGAEDSPFITFDGQMLYFFFTPDLRIPPEKQLLDGVTGIWQSRRAGDGWAEPERVKLSQPGELALDGCEFVLNDFMAFCSVRAGNKREVELYTARLRDGVWTDVKNWGEQINAQYEVGEMHITADGQTMIFASKRAGGLGGYDLWMSSRRGNEWSEPVNLGTPVNTINDENRPYLSPDGQTLWYDSISQKGLPGPAIFRSNRQPDGTWSQPEEMISQFAGEPSLSADGRTLYFIHHYFSADLSQMIEADIYVVPIP